MSEEDTLLESLDNMFVESFRMLDDMIEFEKDPTDAAFDAYFDKYVASIKGLKEADATVFKFMYDEQSVAEQQVVVSILSGELDRAKEQAKRHMDRKRREVNALAVPGGGYLNELKKGREVLLKMAKERDINLEGLDNGQETGQTENTPLS